ncbi:copper homeostasis protein [Wenxinia saemankumensis]|uniref:PF03932 family protein CutC n=2 Tax=Wenxinia saemankumensis TaxID=1447782 RepID=A0A1M6HPD1_9RHOB|nr:copper homeostasis protein [Wenxinia saemankumensis]
MTKLEICVETPEGAALAAATGADRIELCAALDLGGLTPGAGLLAAGIGAGCPVHAMVRPRAGGFAVGAADLAAMEGDIAAIRAAGAAGVVIGAARPDGTLDIAALSRLRDAAGPLEVTLHRVIDLCPDPHAAVEAAIDLGLTRILTSGGPGAAPDNVAALAALVRQAAGRIEIMAGGGVTPAAVPDLLAAGVDAIHASCAAPVDTGAPGIGIPRGRSTDPARLAALKAALSKTSEALCA